MRSKPRGLVLIITNIYYESSYDKHRFSAKHDNTNLKKLFEEMGFIVVSYGNLTGQVHKFVVYVPFIFNIYFININIYIYIYIFIIKILMLSCGY